MNIAGILADRAAASGQLPAFLEAGRAWTFDELERRACGVSAQLHDSGIEPGDRLLILSPMSADLYALLAGIWQAGAVAVFVDPSAGPRHLERCCRAVRPRAFIGVPRAHLLRLVVPSLARVGRQFSLGGAMPFARTLRVDATTRRQRAVVVRDDSDAALMTFTSGSTGEPKAVIRTHGFLRAQHRVLAGELSLQPGDRDLATLPMFVLANLASGVTTLLPGRAVRRGPGAAPARLAREVALARPTRIAASPSFFEQLVAASRLRPAVLGGVRHLHVGGAPVFPRLLRSIAGATASADPIAVYGSTEAEPIASQRWSETTRADREAMSSGAGLLAGHPVRSIDLRIIADRWGRPIPAMSVEQFERESLTPGRIGEIVVAGDHVLAGYGDAALDGTTAFSAGGRTWHRTGDAGSLDARGRLWLAGRCAAKACDERGTLYPLGVESAALEIDGVRRCAFLASEERRLLIVEPERRGAAESIRRSARARLAWAHLDDVVLVPAIPLDRRHRSKVDYPALRRLAGRTA